MKALVAVKRVVDYNVKVRVKADHTGVETAVPSRLNVVSEMYRAWSGLSCIAVTLPAIFEPAPPRSDGT